VREGHLSMRELVAQSSESDSELEGHHVSRVGIAQSVEKK
jgi:hypothetical protein